MKIIPLLLGFLCITFHPQAADKPVDPLPNIQLPVGQIKQMSAHFIKDLIGKGVDLTTDYLIDFSKASFQLERAEWNEETSTISRGFDTQTFRNVTWDHSNNPSYITELLYINLHTGKQFKPDADYRRFRDHDEAKRYWRSFVKTENGFERIQGWVKRTHHRLRNTYYKGAKFPSKEMKFPTDVRVYFRLERLPAVLLNGRTINFRETYHSDHFSVEVPSENGVSRDFELIRKQNSRLHCDYVPSLWIPGLDDGGLNNVKCP